MLSAGTCAALCTQPATVYVRASGNDANDGCSPQNAVRTIRHGATLAGRVGDRIVVGPGTYNEGNIMPSAARVSFVADRRGMLVGEPPGDVVIDATNFSSGFEVNSILAITIDGFVIYGAANGIYLKSQSDQAVVSNNIVSNTGGNGVYIQDSRNVWVFNNLIYNNDGSGILVTGNDKGSPGVRVINNTVYHNRNRGIFIAGSTIGSPNGLVINNVTQDNTTASMATVGIQVNTVSRDGYLSVGNVSFGNRFAAPTDVTDVTDDPLFIDPDGQDQMLGGAGYSDDDFHLAQIAAGQTKTSAAVDVGSERSRTMRMTRGTTRTDGRPDGGIVDAGYHYRNFGPPPKHPELRLRYASLYVSASNGADTNDGTTRSASLQTLTRAFQLARPGHRIELLAGVYREGQLTLTNSGLPGRDILIQASGGAVIDATNSQRGILLSDRSNITLVGLDISGASDSGIEIRNGATDVMVRRCRLHENGQRGLYVNAASGVTVRGDLIDHNGGRGIQVNSGQVDIVASSMIANAEQGLWAMNDSTVAVSGGKFQDNLRSGVLAEQSTVAITDSTISGSKDGGARFTKGSIGTLTRVSVADNTDFGVQGISSLVNLSGGIVEGSTRVGIEGFVEPGSHDRNQLAVTGTRVCHNQGPGIGAQDTAVTLTDVTLCENNSEGLRQSQGTAEILRTRMTQNLGGGLSVDGASEFVVQDAQIDGNADNGMQVMNTTGFEMSGSAVDSNDGNGVTILDSRAPLMRNNLVYANLLSGVLITGDTTGSPNAQFFNNTVFGNHNRGLLIGGSDEKPPSAGALVFRNIFQCNGRTGLQVNTLSLPGYLGDYNLSAEGDFTQPGAHDVIADALLVGAAGGGGALTCMSAPGSDDFHLSQRFAGQSNTSPAVDAGGVDVAAAALAATTTRTDGVPDSGLADLGYHYQP